MRYDTKLPPELQEQVSSIWEASVEAGLDCFPTIFELIDYAQLAEIAAYGGFPTRYPHWRFGMEFDKISKSYTYGLSIIYEMVINTNPCYAYLLRANNMVDQKTVIAHVYGHCDFFKNNYWFSKTNRKMLDQMANHANLIRSFIDDVGHDEVEDWIDVCLSLENLIDIHAPFYESAKGGAGDDESYRPDPVSKLPAKKYMDAYINPQDFIDQQKLRQKEERERARQFPETPKKDVLKFLIDFAPMNAWQKRVLQIIRDEAYYFAPQGQTKIINEGWATYWHSKMMTKLHPLKSSEIVDYCDHYAGVVASHPGQLNPYKLGVELLRHIENRWDKGRFGIDYLMCDDARHRAQWDTQAGKGIEKIFEVRKMHNDITFLDEFLDEDFCHEHKMFIYDYDQRANEYVISGRGFPEVKNRLLAQLTNFGNPIIEVHDANYKNRGELLLRHRFEGMELQQNFTTESLKNLYRIWTRPVHIETVLEEATKRVSFDGSEVQVEKVS